MNDHSIVMDVTPADAAASARRPSQPCFRIVHAVRPGGAPNDHLL